MKVRKEVSLCLETAQIAQRMNNFSAWIREMLIDFDAGITIEAYQRENARLSQLISDIIDGNKVWEQGTGWVEVE